MVDRRLALVWVAALLTVAFVFWPVREGGFVWDDEIDFLKYDWLTRGDEWKHYIFRDFHGWTNYFRPLVVGLFTLQLRLFDIAPGPMHLVSLGTHLANTLMVGTLAVRLADRAGQTPSRTKLLTCVAMGIYGLHPAQIEPVAWIASQFDLFATFFMLLGLNLNLSIAGKRERAASVAICFFMAACSKESALSFPLLLTVTDWLRESGEARQNRLSVGIPEFFRRNRMTFLAVIAAGMAYLVFRYWALGLLNVPTPADGPSLFGRVHTASFLFWRYALMTIAPTVGMGPLHPFDPLAFEQFDLTAIMTISLAVGAVGSCIWVAITRRSVAACVVLAFAAGLLPVLRLIPSPYENELYCSRYLMTSLAVLCAMLPLLLSRYCNAIHRVRSLRPALLAISLAWVSMSAITIRSTLPLWSNSISLWRWALTLDPTSARAANALLIAYADRGLSEDARMLARDISARQITCFNCMLTMVEVNLRDRDFAGARAALQLAAAALDDPVINADMRLRFAKLSDIVEERDPPEAD